MDEKRCAAASRAGHVKRAANRLDAIAEPGQPGSLRGVGSPDSVVANYQPYRPVRSVEFDAHC